MDEREVTSLAQVSRPLVSHQKILMTRKPGRGVKASGPLRRECLASARTSPFVHSRRIGRAIDRAPIFSDEKHLRIPPPTGEEETELPECIASKLARSSEVGPNLTNP